MTTMGSPDRSATPGLMILISLPNSNAGGTLSQQYNPAADYGNANWDVRNRVSAVFTYSMPAMAVRN